MRPLLLAVYVLLVACATQVPETIRAAPSGDLSVAEARQNLDVHLGRRVRWGGTIASVDNRAEETWVEIVARELGSNGRPRASDRSLGRFMARVAGFLDPAVYSEGRQLTVAGTLARSITQPIGQFKYTYPVVQVETVYLWEPLPEARDYPYYYDPFWPYDPFWYPWHPWRYPYYPYPYR